MTGLTKILSKENFQAFGINLLAGGDGESGNLESGNEVCCVSLVLKKLFIIRFFEVLSEF